MNAWRPPAARLIRHGVAACLLATALAPAPARAAEDGLVLERRVKAAFLFRFASYVEWPAAAFPRTDTPLTIGVLGDERFARELGRLVAGKRFGDREVVVVRLQPFESAAGVHVLFVAHGETPRLRELLAAARPAHTLVVTEADAGLAHGGMINFVLSEGRVRFQVFLPAVSRAGLALHSGLLAVAHTVIRNP